MDDDVTPLIIENPPRISLRRKVEKLAETLTLVAFNAFGDSPGKFLMAFSVLSQTCRYASTLATCIYSLGTTRIRRRPDYAVAKGEGRRH